MQIFRTARGPESCEGGPGAWCLLARAPGAVGSLNEGATCSTSGCGRSGTGHRPRASPPSKEPPCRRCQLVLRGPRARLRCADILRSLRTSGAGQGSGPAAADWSEGRHACLSHSTLRRAEVLPRPDAQLWSACRPGTGSADVCGTCAKRKHQTRSLFWMIKLQINENKHQSISMPRHHSNPALCRRGRKEIKS